MEKNKGLFDVSLDSMLNSTPIEVDAATDTMFPTELMSVEKPDKKDDKEVDDDIEKDLIDLDPEESDTSEKEDDTEEEDDDEETPEEPSSNKESPLKSTKQKSSPLTPYAQLLIDEGILPNLDIKEFDGSADSLKEAMVDEIIGAVETYKDSLPNKIKLLINNYEEGVPLEKLLEIDKVETDIEQISDEKLEEDVSLQKKIVTDYLKKTTKFSDTKITKLVESYEDSGDLEDEAKNSLGELKTFVVSEKKREKENSEKQRVEAENQRKRDLVTLQEKIKNTEEIVPGIKLNDKVRNNMFAAMTTAVGYDQTGRPVNKIVAARQENPVEFEIKLHYLFEITKGFTDFSKIAEKGKKDASKSFEEAVEGLDKNEGAESTSPIRKSKNDDFFKVLAKTYKL